MTSFLALLGRGLLRVLPREFRDRFGGEVADHLLTRTRELRSRGSRLDVVRFWVRATVDLTRTGIAERREDLSWHGSGQDGGPLSDLGLDVRFALRGLKRSPGFTVVAVVTLALGIGASTAMFTVLDAAMRRALPFPEPHGLVMGRGTSGGNVNPLATFPDYMDYRDQSRSLEALAAIGGGAGLATVTGTGEPEQARVTDITPNLFETLGVRPALGTTFTIAEQPVEGGGQVVIGHGFWQRWFGSDPDVVGRSLTVEGKVLTVMGVMPAGFRILFDVDLWTPPWPGHSTPINRRYSNWLLVGRLVDGVSLEAARSEIDAIAAHLQEAYPDTNEGRGLRLDPLHSVMVEGARQSLWILTGAIALVLLIACGNVASLLMAKGCARAGEIALRSALGAGRGRLARQLLVECAVLALAAGGLGVALAIWLQDAILGFVPMDLLGLRDVGVSLGMLGIGMAISLGTVFLFGVFPSLSAAKVDPAEELKEGARGSTSGSTIRYRSGLLVVQVALSLILLVGSGLLIRSFAGLHSVDPGFRVKNLLTATVALPSDDYQDREPRIQFFRTLKEDIEALPGVESVALIDRLPVLQIWGNYRIRTPGGSIDDSRVTADRRVILPGYFETMGIPFVDGRPLAESDVAGSTPVVVLNQRAAEVLYPGESAVGRQVIVDMGSRGEPATLEVVGIVQDHRHTSLASAPTRRAMFFPYAQLQERTMRLAVATAVDPTTLVRPIQERVWQLDRDIVLSDTRTMEDALADSIAGSRSMATVLALFATVALALAALGLYGVLAYFVTQRMHEIGIRVALGASRGSVLRLVVRQGMILVGIGSVLGIGGAVGATRLVQGLLFEVSATDPATFGAVTGFFLLVALGACLLPASRALRVDPVEAFRAE